MITWGVSSESHNAALSVFVGDTIIFASESERFTGIKNDPTISDDLIKHALSFGKPELVCWYENPYKKTLRQIIAGQGWNQNFKKYIDCPIRYYDHHYTHACGGYFTSGYTDSAIVVIDAIGEFQTLTIWKAEGNKLELKYELKYPHSIGLWYSAMTQRCGLKPNEEEYILMGMSAYGDPTRLTCDIFDDFIGEEFKFKKNLHRGCLDWRPDLNTERDYFDIAAGTQTVYEILFRKILELSKTLVKSDNLVLMGGCALNCSANPIAFNYYHNVWIMPAPGDNGSSIGAVLADKKKHISWTNPYLGYNIGSKNHNIEIVNYLRKYKICGLARDRAEFGPRALGNRSLLADPRGMRIKDRVNKIKKRQEFRPFAPVILEEYASEYFQMPTISSPYMQFTVKCKRPDLFPAIVHVDGTSRVQTLSKKDNPKFRKLLELWYEKTGCPMLLNTSLNIKGQPIINDETQAREWENLYNVKVWT